MVETSHSQTPEDIAPGRYIEKVSLLTGEVMNEEILPKQLLVQNHRDYHVVDIQARTIMSQALRSTGNEDMVRNIMKEVRRVGLGATDLLGKVIGQGNADSVAQALFGLKEREYFFRFKKPPYSKEEIKNWLGQLRREAIEQFAATMRDGRPAIRFLLTGGTGFVGQEIIWQAAHDDAITEVVILIRPKDIIDRKTKKVIRTLSPAERGEELLRRLWLVTPEQQAKFRFIAGDIEQPQLGVSPEDMADLQRTMTHVIHCAASVSFDDPYEKSFHVNVTGTLNALDFSLRLQTAPESPFVAHVGIETSYIHGRMKRELAREDEVVFPKNFYNNYYELTKAMASIETERFMMEKGLRVIELCPSIVIGESRAGNNRGDAKVVNAPINLFGRAKQAAANTKGGIIERSTAVMLARMASVFPADPSAQLNVIPVDWVVKGIIAALHKPEAVGERIHLATDNRISTAEMQEVMREELRVNIKMTNPTLHRNVTLPLASKVLALVHQERMGNVLEKLSTIFGGYSEWGQPVHEVGKDVAILGLSEPRPNTKSAFRMLCRHNRYVMQYGEIRDLDEISRREKVWLEFIENLEKSTGQPAGLIPADMFREAVKTNLDTEKFEIVSGAAAPAKEPEPAQKPQPAKKPAKGAAQRPARKAPAKAAAKAGAKT
jgi:nucleoside-diphosphate-sugar epimerase